MRLAQLKPSSASSTAIIEGVLIVSPWKDAVAELPPWVRRKILGRGQGGCSSPAARPRAGSGPACRAAPRRPAPSARNRWRHRACARQMAMANTAEVASQRMRPGRSSVIQSPFGTRTPEVVPFQGKRMSRSGSPTARGPASGRTALRRMRTSASLQLLPVSVTQPSPKLSHATTSTPRAPSSATSPSRRRRCRRPGREASRHSAGSAEQGARERHHLADPRLGPARSGASGRPGGVRAASDQPGRLRSGPSRSGVRTGGDVRSSCGCRAAAAARRRCMPCGCNRR